jgi:hypothetical protein
MVILALYVYMTHWRLAQQMARRNEEERRASLRWLYLYGTLGFLLISMLITGFAVIATFVDILTPFERPWICFFCIEAPDMGFYFPEASATEWVALPLLILLCMYHWRVIRRDLHIIAEDKHLFLFHTVFSYGIGAMGFLLIVLGVIGTLDWVLPLIRGQEATPSANNLAILLVSLPLASFFTIGLRAEREPKVITILRGVFTYGFSGLGLYLFVRGISQLPERTYSVIESDNLLLLSYDTYSMDGIWKIFVGLVIWLLAWKVSQKRLFESDVQIRWSIWQMRYSYLVVIVSSWITFIIGAQFIDMCFRHILGSYQIDQLSTTDLWFKLIHLIVVAFVWVYHLRVIRSDEELADTALRSIINHIYLYISYTVGLVAFLLGSGAWLSVVIRALLPMEVFSSGLRNEMAWFGALAIVGIAVWQYYSAFLRREARLMSEGFGEHAFIWNTLHIISLVGFVGLLVGLAGELSLLIRSLSAELFGHGIRHELALFASAVMVGLPAWVLPWRKAQRGVTEMIGPPNAENHRSITRNVYLYTCIFVSILTVLWGLVLATAEFLQIPQITGGAGFLLFGLGRAIGFILVGVLGFIYFRMTLLSERESEQQEKVLFGDHPEQ